jgi:hypothetical protein
MTNTTVYRIAKGFISFFMLFSAYYSFANVDALRHLGFPDYFRIELVTAKVVGALLLLVPQVGVSLKEWIYAGFGIAMVSALIAHISSGDPVSKVIFVAIDFILFVLSVRYVRKYERKSLLKAAHSKS